MKERLKKYRKKLPVAILLMVLLSVSGFSFPVSSALFSLNTAEQTLRLPGISSYLREQHASGSRKTHQLEKIFLDPFLEDALKIQEVQDILNQWNRKENSRPFQEIYRSLFQIKTSQKKNTILFRVKAKNSSDAAILLRIHIQLVKSSLSHLLQAIANKQEKITAEKLAKVKFVVKHQKKGELVLQQNVLQKEFKALQDRLEKIEERLLNVLQQQSEVEAEQALEVWKQDDSLKQKKIQLEEMNLLFQEMQKKLKKQHPRVQKQLRAIRELTLKIRDVEYEKSQKYEIKRSSLYATEKAMREEMANLEKRAHYILRSIEKFSQLEKNASQMQLSAEVLQERVRKIQKFPFWFERMLKEGVGGDSKNLLYLFLCISGVLSVFFLQRSQEKKVFSEPLKRAQRWVKNRASRKQEPLPVQDKSTVRQISKKRLDSCSLEKDWVSGDLPGDRVFPGFSFFNKNREERSEGL